MTRWTLALSALLLTACQPAPLLASAPARADAIVGFQPDLPEARRAALRARYGAKDVMGLLPNAERWRLANVDLAEVAAEPGVRYAQPNGTHALESFGDPSAPVGLASLDQGAPSDPGFAKQWNMTAARFPEAWATATGQGVMVAVIDSGVDAQHPDLAANLLPGIDETAAFGIADTLDGTDYAGRDSVGHGTHVSGIIGAVTDNGLGVAGGAPHVRILPIKVTDGEFTDDERLAKGVADAVAAGAKVINMSIGGAATPKPSFKDAVDLALANGVTVVVAAGNDSASLDYPASEHGVIAVGAALSSGEKAHYSNFGPGLTLIAPGGGQSSSEGPAVYSTLPTYWCEMTAQYGKDYGAVPGTSMAAPHVTAAVALLLEREPTLTPAQIWTRVASTTSGRSLMGFDPNRGFGELDAAAVLGGGSADGR